MSHLSTQIINGKNIASILEKKLAIKSKQIHKLYDKKPSLKVLLSTDNKSSELYIQKKKEACERCHIDFHLYKTKTPNEIIETIHYLNNDVNTHGIIVQLPLPPAYDTNSLLELINPYKDVDGILSENLGRLQLNYPYHSFPQSGTANACVRLIKSVCPDLRGKHAVIIGRSRIVGKPLLSLLLNENCTCSIIHSHTQNPQLLSKQADILIAAVGSPQLIDKHWLKYGAVVIDVGISKVQGKVLGDVNINDAMGLALAITPVPGGVGPMTVVSLMENVIKSAENLLALNS